MLQTTTTTITIIITVITTITRKGENANRKKSLARKNILTVSSRPTFEDNARSRALSFGMLAILFLINGFISQVKSSRIKSVTSGEDGVVAGESSNKTTTPNDDDNDDAADVKMSETHEPTSTASSASRVARFQGPITKKHFCNYLLADNYCWYNFDKATRY